MDPKRYVWLSRIKFDSQKSEKKLDSQKSQHKNLTVKSQKLDSQESNLNSPKKVVDEISEITLKWRHEDI